MHAAVGVSNRERRPTRDRWGTVYRNSTFFCPNCVLSDDGGFSNEDLPASSVPQRRLLFLLLIVLRHDRPKPHGIAHASVVLRNFYRPKPRGIGHRVTVKCEFPPHVGNDLGEGDMEPTEPMKEPPKCLRSPLRLP